MHNTMSYHAVHLYTGKHSFDMLDNSDYIKVLLAQ